MAKTTQATRNIRKFVKRQSSGVKGRMITDDYGNRYSTKASGGRRHTLSRGKKRADRLNYEDKLYNTRKKSETGHAASARRRSNIGEVDKSIYHGARSRGNNSTAKRMATERAKAIHGSIRKPKDFTK